jgi:hypothetical protein
LAPLAVFSKLDGLTRFGWEGFLWDHTDSVNRPHHDQQGSDVGSIRPTADLVFLLVDG